MGKIKRLTISETEGIFRKIMNFCTVENSEAVLHFTENKKIPLAEYIAESANKYFGCQDITYEMVMEGDACFDFCDCPMVTINVLGIQAAEQRERLLKIEDILGEEYDLEYLQDLIKEDEKRKRMEMKKEVMVCCVYRTDDGLCKKHSTDVITSYCVDGPCTDEILTNEEWLKSLSTEELAEELARIAEWDREQVKKAKHTVGLVEFMKHWLGEKHKEKQKK